MVATIDEGAGLVSICNVLVSERAIRCFGVVGS